MHVIITSPTAGEMELIKSALENLSLAGVEVSFHTSGVGMMASTYSISTLLQHEKPNLIIQCGIAGSFTDNDDVGEVFIVETECICAGAEESNNWKDLFDLGFADADAFPFTSGKLVNPWANQWNKIPLPLAEGLTVEEISTNKKKMMLLKNKYGISLESMEGAPFHYVCLQQQVPFLQIRAISNKAGERDKHKWKIDRALKNLTSAVVKTISLLCSK